MKRSTDNRRSPAEIKYDLQRHYGGLEHGNADMTDFRRPAYSVRHPKQDCNDIQNMSIQQQNVAPYIKSEYGTPKPGAAALIRAQGEQIRRASVEEYLKDKTGSDADGRIQPGRVPGPCSRSRGAGGTGL